MFGRALIAVAAIAGLFALGNMDRGPAIAPHGPYDRRPATDVERLTHDLRQAWELDQVDGVQGNGPDNGWGADR